jgi:hypothetical protein
MLRKDCNQPATRTRSPACASTSVVRTRFIENAPLSFFCVRQKTKSPHPLIGGRGQNNLAYRGTTTIYPNRMGPSSILSLDDYFGIRKSKLARNADNHAQGRQIAAR